MSIIIRIKRKRPLCSTCHKHFPVLSSFMTYHRVCNESNTKVATSGTSTSYPSGAPEFTPVSSEVHVARSLVFCVVFCGSLFDLFPLAIVLFLLLRFTDYDTLLVSSNSFYVICSKLSILTWHFYIYAVRSNICSMVALPFTIYKFVLFND